MRRIESEAATAQIGSCDSLSAFAHESNVTFAEAAADCLAEESVTASM